MGSDEDYSSDEHLSNNQPFSYQILQELWNATRGDGDPADVRGFGAPIPLSSDEDDSEEDDYDSEEDEYDSEEEDFDDSEEEEEYEDSEEEEDYEEDDYDEVDPREESIFAQNFRCNDEAGVDDQSIEISEDSRKILEMFNKMKEFHHVMDTGPDKITRLALFDYYMDYFKGTLDTHLRDPRIPWSQMENYGYGSSHTHLRKPAVYADIADLAITNYDYTNLYNIKHVSVFTKINPVFSVRLTPLRLSLSRDIPRQPIAIASSGVGSQKYVLNKTKDNVETEGNYDDFYDDQGLKPLKVTKLEDVLFKGSWTGDDMSDKYIHQSFNNSTTVTYKDYIINLKHWGIPALEITKMDPRTITKNRYTSEHLGKWFIQLFNSEAHYENYADERYDRKDTDKASENICFMKICQLGGRSKLFVCMSQSDDSRDFDFPVSYEKQFEMFQKENFSGYDGDGCRIYDIEEMIEVCLDDDEEMLELPYLGDEIHYIQYNPQFVLATYGSVWSCDTYDGKDFQIVALGTNEHKVRLYYHSNQLSKKITGGRYFYKCFPIEFLSNIPTLSFNLNDINNSNDVFLTVGTIDGYIYSIKLDLEKELQNLKTFFPVLNFNPKTVSRELVDRFLLAQAIVRGSYEVYDKTNLGNCVWTITKLNGKTDFMPVKTWKDLTGCEFDDFNREKEHECIKTEFLLGSGFDPELVETDDYNIGALMTTMAVPTFPLKKLYDNILRENDDKILFNQANFNFARVEELADSDDIQISYEMGSLFSRNKTPSLLLDNGVMSVEHRAYVNPFVVDDIQGIEPLRYEETIQMQRLREESKIKFSRRSKVKKASQQVLIDTTHRTDESFTERKFKPRYFYGSARFSNTEAYYYSYRIWNKHITKYSQDDLRKLKKFFHLIDDLHEHILSADRYIELRKIFKKLFENEDLVIDLNSSDKTNRKQEERYQMELIITFKQFEKDCLNVSNFDTIIDKLLKELKKPDIADEMCFSIGDDYYHSLFMRYNESPVTLPKQESLFTLTQREKLTYLYLGNLIGKEDTTTKILEDEYSFVTTENGIYLLFGQPLLVKAYTPNVIFDVTEFCSPYHDYLVNSNRISISLHIKELCCVAVASQIGLVSIMRLTDYKGVKSFNQECVLGLKVLKEHTPFLKRVPPVSNTIFSREAYYNIGDKGSNYNQRLQDSNVDFPMATITGMTYRMISFNSCRLSVHSQKGTFHYKISL